MEIIKIQESGANNTLLWAIKNGANIRDDLQLQSIINDELCYLITLKDINFLELFRLTQMYRNKIRIIDVVNATIPPRTEMIQKFPGHLISEDTENPPLIGVLAEHACKAFYNIALQMTADDDIIQPGTASMYLPMITRRYTVQIPVNFVDFVGSMSTEESEKIFNRDYPSTIDSILEAEVHGVKTIISMGFVKSTAVIRYHDRYDKYLQRIRYSPLKSFKGTGLYRIGLLGFSKYNLITRGEVRCSMFQTSRDVMTDTLKKLSKMSNIRTPLKLDVVVQLPIDEMLILYSSYSREDLPMFCDSSIVDILDTGIIFSNFTTPDPEDEKHDEILNGIDAYKTRIAEANQMTINAINLIVNSEEDVDVTAAFALLPASYTAKVVMTVDTSKQSMFTGHSSIILSSMFQEIFKIADSIQNDIAKME